MKKRFSKSTAWILTLTITLALLSTSILIFSRVQPVSAQTTTIYLDPSKIVFNASVVPVGSRFNVTAWVSSVTNLFGFQVTVYYNASIINMTQAWRPDWNSSYVFYGQFGMPVGPSYGYFDSWGYGLVGFSGLGGMTTPFSGSGLLAIFEFEIMISPSDGILVSDLVISYKPPGGTFDTKLRDSAASVIPFTAEDGRFEYFSGEAPSLPPDVVSISPIWGYEDQTTAIHVYGSDFVDTPTVEVNGYGCTDVVFIDSGHLTCTVPAISATGFYDVIVTNPDVQSDTLLNGFEVRESPPEGTQLYVDPEEIINPTLLPPGTVEINITIDDVANLYGYEFNLTFDQNVLICLMIMPHDVLGETNYIPQFIVDNFNGFIWVNVTYYSPATPITTDIPVALVTITFRIKSVGASPLHLHNTSLKDHYGNMISHEVSDGYIMTLIRDLAVLNVTLSENIVYQGWPVNITVVVKNEGYITETFDVNFYYNSTSIGNQTVTDLAPDEETTVIFTWYTTTVEPYINHTIKAEIPPVLYEIDTADNILADGTLMVVIEGDINGDGVVDIDDMTIIAQAFGSYPGHPRWNPEADLNGDGLVDITDIAIVAINFGKHYP